MDSLVLRPVWQTLGTQTIGSGQTWKVTIMERSEARKLNAEIESSRPTVRSKEGVMLNVGLDGQLWVTQYRRTQPWHRTIVHSHESEQYLLKHCKSSRDRDRAISSIRVALFNGRHKR